MLHYTHLALATLAQVPTTQGAAADPWWQRWYFMVQEMPIVLNILGAIITVVVVMIAYGFLIRGLKVMQRRQRISASMVVLFQRGLRWVAVVVAVLLALQTLGIVENAWAATTAVLGLVAVGFVAVWSVLSNGLCAVLLILNRLFEIGDEIEIPAEAGGIKGRVVNFNMLHTTLEGDDGVLIQVPNNLFFQKPVKRRPGHRANAETSTLTQ